MFLKYTCMGCQLGLPKPITMKPDIKQKFIYSIARVTKNQHMYISRQGCAHSLT